MNSGFSNVIRHKDTTKLKSFITAIALQALFLPLLFTLLYLYPNTTTLVKGIGLPPLYLIGSAVGGFFFGIFMYFTAGCGAGIFYKIGEKNSGALLAAIGFSIGIYLTEKGLLKPLRHLSQEAVLFSQTPLWKGETALINAGAIAVFALVILVLLLKTTDKAPKGAQWGWKKTGVLIGSIGILSWLLALTANSPYGMAVIPGVLDAMDLKASWGLLFVIGIVVGAFFSTRKNPSKRFLRPKKEIVIRRLFGGFGLGVSGSIAAGCTVGHGLTFTPILGLGSWVATLFIFLGSGLVGFLTRPKTKL